MRRAAGFLAALIILSWGAYRLQQEPRVRSLFGSSQKEDSGASFPLENKLVVVRRGPPAGESPGEVKAASGAAATQAPPAANAPAALHNRVDNATVELVLLQILAAKKLGDGIALSVTDGFVRVAGTAGSEDDRRRILDIIEKGRESRQIDASALRVRRE